MTEFVRFNARFEYKDVDGRRTRYPAGWAGEVEPAVAAEARKQKVIPPVDAGPATATDIQAARAAVKAAEGKLKAAKNDAEKAAAEGDLTAARAALTSLEA